MRTGKCVPCGHTSLSPPVAVNDSGSRRTARAPHGGSGRRTPPRLGPVIPSLCVGGGEALPFPLAPSALFPCHTKAVARNVTIRISDEAALWARRKAAEENTSVSRLVGEMLERRMRVTDDYWRAFERWKWSRPLAASGAAQRMTREQARERR